MTREEAIKVLNNFPIDFRNSGGFEAMEALKIAILALRPVSREQVERMFPGCPGCDSVSSKWEIRFCPFCGKPRTDEAVEMVMERWKELLDEVR